MALNRLARSLSTEMGMKRTTPSVRPIFWSHCRAEVMFSTKILDFIEQLNVHGATRINIRIDL
jgi:hypothetical protein